MKERRHPNYKPREHPDEELHHSTRLDWAEQRSPLLPTEGAVSTSVESYDANGPTLALWRSTSAPWRRRAGARWSRWAGG